MIRKSIKLALVFTIATIMFACKNEPKTEVKSSEVKVEEKAIDVKNLEHIRTKEDQDKLTPDVVLKKLKEGNERFRNGIETHRDHSEQVRNYESGQYPKAIVLGCIDSRVPVEDVFDQGIGDLFVGRVAGNVVNEDQLGSMEYACKVAGAKLVMVLGHEHCGAVKSAIDDVKLGNITALLTKIKPALLKSQDFTGKKTSKNEAFVKHVCENNIRNTIEQIRAKSPILKEMETKGQIKIVGAYFDLSDSSLEFVQ